MPKLEVTVVNCRGVKGFDLFSKSDPYVKLEYGDKTFKTAVRQDAGPDADFNETFSFKFVPPHYELLVEVRDKDLMGSQKMGSAIIDLWDVKDSKFLHGNYDVLDKQGRPNGHVALELRYRE